MDTWKGYYLKEGALVKLEFNNFKCDPNYGIISGTTV